MVQSYWFIKLMKIRNILLRELEKTNKNIGIIKDDIEDLPKGSLVKTRAKGNVYVYLKYREDKQVKSVYIGRDNDVETLKMDSDIRKRKKLEASLEELEEEKELILKMLKVK